ncbi:MAG: carbohydrate ABC transporter permease [Rhizobiaceae bacterium]|jgi:glycerol transport system permease protein|nr:carbohydrate ABC transporter permease [Rhizobiaceae bacterium]
MTPRHPPLLPLLFAAFIAIPVYWLVTMSFKTNGEIFGGLTPFPAAPTLDNYRVIFSDPDWWMGYVHAAAYAGLNAVIAVSVAVPAAYALSRGGFRGTRALLFGLLAFRMMAPAILLIPFVEIFTRAQLMDTYLAVALAHCFFNVPLAIWILEGFISAVPRELDETAALDGHSTGRFLIRILVPQIAPGIAVTAFFCFLFSWVEFLLANALTVIDIKPIGAIMTRLGGVMTADVAVFSAASVIGLLPGLVLILAVRKHLARGFSLGRVT